MDKLFDKINKLNLKYELLFDFENLKLKLEKFIDFEAEPVTEVQLKKLQAIDLRKFHHDINFLMLTKDEAQEILNILHELK
jgi:hypothetical protein